MGCVYTDGNECKPCFNGCKTCKGPKKTHVLFGMLTQNLILIGFHLGTDVFFLIFFFEINFFMIIAIGMAFTRMEMYASLVLKDVKNVQDQVHGKTIIIVI